MLEPMLEWRPRLLQVCCAYVSGKDLDAKDVEFLSSKVDGASFLKACLRTLDTIYVDVGMPWISP